jgi:DNA polymerase-1
MTERSLIIDGTNIFYRAYVVNPSLSNSGLPVGGLVGFLKSLQKLIREMKPTKVFVCWDGAGGSSRRRSVVSSYKEGRKAIRLNRSTGVSLSLEEENQSKLRQIMRLFEYLDNLPLIQLMHDGVEADDMISILCQELRGEQKIIVSSDKDFYQLLDDETIIYRPVQAVFKTKKDIVEEFQIHPNNFALARAVSGDKSDNLQGVKGAGLKTLAKRFPFLVEEKDYSLTDLVDACEETENKLKIHEGILDNYDKILKNYKIMQLYVPNVSFQVRDIVKNAKENYSRYYNKTEIVKMMFTDGFPQISWTDLFAHSNRIASIKD